MIEGHSSFVIFVFSTLASIIGYLKTIDILYIFVIMHIAMYVVMLITNRHTTSKFNQSIKSLKIELKACSDELARLKRSHDAAEAATNVEKIRNQDRLNEISQNIMSLAKQKSNVNGLLIEDRMMEARNISQQIRSIYSDLADKDLSYINQMSKEFERQRHFMRQIARHHSDEFCALFSGPNLNSVNFEYVDDIRRYLPDFLMTKQNIKSATTYEQKIFKSKYCNLIAQLEFHDQASPKIDSFIHKLKQT